MTLCIVVSAQLISYVTTDFYLKLMNINANEGCEIVQPMKNIIK